MSESSASDEPDDMSQDNTLTYFFDDYVKSTPSTITATDGHRVFECSCAHQGDFTHDEAECVEAECTACGYLRCPHTEPLHFHHDGCPSCDSPN